MYGKKKIRHTHNVLYSLYLSDAVMQHPRDALILCVTYLEGNAANRLKEYDL